MRTLALRLPAGPWPRWLAELAACAGHLHDNVQVVVWEASTPAGAWVRQSQPLQAAVPADWVAAAGLVPAGRAEPWVADLLIDFCPWLPLPGEVVERWTLADGQGHALTGPWPGLADWSRGMGATAALRLQRVPGAPWRQGPEVSLATTPAEAAGIDAAFRAALHLLRRSLEAWQRDLPVPVKDVVPPPSAPPSAARAGALRGLALLRHEVRRLRDRWFTEHWRVGIIEAPIHTLLQQASLPPVRWITPPEAAGYWADPFGVPGDPAHLLCERYDEATERGHIERLRWDGRQVQTEARLPVGGGLHVSFPNVFRLDGRLLAMPETGLQRECVLHEVQADGSWKPLATLLQGVAVADPALFHWQGRYWLAYTDADAEVWGNLCLAWAERLEGPWQPHAFNPVKLDVSGARMAGNFFWHEGQLYRPGQDCRHGYGAGLALYRVLQCSATQYCEEPVARFAPNPHGPCPDGLHTLNAWGELTLVDGKRWCFNLSKVLQRAGRLLGLRRGAKGVAL